MPLFPLHTEGTDPPQLGHFGKRFGTAGPGRYVWVGAEALLQVTSVRFLGLSTQAGFDREPRAVGMLGARLERFLPEAPRA